MTAKQIELVSMPYQRGLTQEEKDKFSDTRKQIEENIDLYREDLTFLDPYSIQISRLLHIVWEYWKAPQNRRGLSVGELIAESKRAYTKLTISNIKDMDKVIDDFERLQGDFNSTEFLTTISRLYTYISELQQLIQSEKLSGITFYEFVEQGCLARLIKVFSIIKTFAIKKLGFEKDAAKQIKFIAVDCVQSINRQLKGVLSHFIDCSQSLLSASTPSFPDLIKEDGLYDSAQHFFANYYYNLVEALVRQETDASSLGTESDSTLKISLYENKDLRQVQI